MQIHELNQYIGTPGEGDVLPIDDGNKTFKIEAAKLGVTTKMTKAEAIAGTETEPRILQPSVFKEIIETLNPNPTYYGTCSTAAGTTTKAVTCPDFVLKTGAMIAVSFANTNSVGSPYLNVNSTGAKAIRTADGSTDSIANAWAAGAVVLFVYDGTSWIFVSTSKIPTVADTFSISRTGGATGATIDTSATIFNRNGNLVSTMLVITKATEDIAAGGNIFTGTLNTTKLRPTGVSAGLVGYIGQRPIIAQINSAGNIVVRNTSATALTMGGSLYVYGTYLI